MLASLNVLLFAVVWLVLGVAACAAVSKWIADRRGMTVEQYARSLESDDSKPFSLFDFIVLVLWPIPVVVMIFIEIFKPEKEDEE